MKKGKGDDVRIRFGGRREWTKGFTGEVTMRTVVISAKKCRRFYLVGRPTTKSPRGNIIMTLNSCDGTRRYGIH